MADRRTVRIPDPTIFCRSFPERSDRSQGATRRADGVAGAPDRPGSHVSLKHVTARTDTLVVRPEDAEARRGLRWRSGAAYFLAAGVLCVCALLTPGYLRGGPWRIAFVGIMACVVGTSAFVSIVHALTNPMRIILIYLADAFLVGGQLCIADPGSIRLGAVIFALPMMFAALFLSRKQFVIQGVAVGIGTGVVMWAAGDPPGFFGVHVAVVLAVVLIPSGSLLLLRGQLDASLARERDLADHDPLTGLVNRRGLMSGIGEVVARSRAVQAEVVIAVCDVDFFKRINDEHGHAFGDQVLSRVSQALRSHTRPTDLVVRLGGEEFAVVAALDQESVAGFAERIREEVAFQLIDLGVTISIGVAWAHPSSWCDEQSALWLLVDRADDLLYQAKRQGRNLVIVGDEPALV